MLKTILTNTKKGHTNTLFVTFRNETGLFWGSFPSWGAGMGWKGCTPLPLFLEDGDITTDRIKVGGGGLTLTYVLDMNL